MDILGVDSGLGRVPSGELQLTLAKRLAFLEGCRGIDSSRSLRKQYRFVGWSGFSLRTDPGRTSLSDPPSSPTSRVKHGDPSPQGFPVTDPSGPETFGYDK